MSYQTFPKISGSITDGYVIVYDIIDGYYKPQLLQGSTFTGILPLANTQAQSPVVTSKLGSCIHRWLCNDITGSGTIVDDGSMANATMTIQNPTNSSQGESGLYCDSISMVTNAWAKSADNVGIPVSNTTLTIHGWVRLLSYTANARFITKGYNPTFATPYISIEVLQSGTSGQFWAQWVTGGVVKSSAATPVGRGQIPLNQWCYLAVTFSQAAGSMTMNFYLNGNFVLNSVIVSGVIDWNSGASGPWAFGNVSAGLGTVVINGWQFDWRVEDGIVLTQDQIIANYKAGKGLAY